ncbi:hypothetical protein HDU96_008888 [Phlyctochytrium bullatum]|nr:hypothetical protein HDU96_008888 [Phlyctochytrium bullatum]
MQEYKREYERANEQVQELTRLQFERQKQNEVLSSFLATILEDLSLEVAKIEGKAPAAPEETKALDSIANDSGSEAHLAELRAKVTEKLETIRNGLASAEKVKELEEKLDETRASRIVLERKLDKAKVTALSQKGGEVMKREGSEDTSEASTIAQLRLKEIEELKSERLELSDKLEALRVQAELQFLKDENNCLRNRIDKLLIDYEDLISERRKIADDYDKDLLSKQKILEAEINTLKADLNRVRENRNGLQQTLELRNAKDEAELLQNQEIRKIANSRKDRIAFLESRIEILKMQAASESNGTFWVEFFSENPKGNPFEEVRKQLRAAEEKVEELERALRISKDANEEKRKLDDILISESLLKDEVAKLQEKLQACESGAHANLEEKVKELSVKLDFAKKTELHLYAEIDSISKAWADLEERSMKKAVNLTEKEEQILRLVAEKTKLEQKCQMLSKHISTSNMMNTALKRQSEKQLEQIRKLEEREKLLSQQLQTVEKDFSTKTITADLHRRKVAELSQKNAELNDRFEKILVRYQELEKLVREKSRALIEENDAKRRILEQVEVTKKKLESIQAKPDHGGDPGIKPEEYEALKVEYFAISFIVYRDHPYPSGFPLFYHLPYFN